MAQRASRRQKCDNIGHRASVHARTGLPPDMPERLRAHLERSPGTKLAAGGAISARGIEIDPIADRAIAKNESIIV